MIRKKSSESEVKINFSFSRNIYVNSVSDETFPELYGESYCNKKSGKINKQGSFKKNKLSPILDKLDNCRFMDMTNFTKNFQEFLSEKEYNLTEGNKLKIIDENDYELRLKNNSKKTTKFYKSETSNSIRDLNPLCSPVKNKNSPSLPKSILKIKKSSSMSVVKHNDYLGTESSDKITTIPSPEDLENTMSYKPKDIDKLKIFKEFECSVKKIQKFVKRFLMKRKFNKSEINNGKRDSYNINIVNSERNEKDANEGSVREKENFSFQKSQTLQSPNFLHFSKDSKRDLYLSIDSCNLNSSSFQASEISIRTIDTDSIDEHEDSYDD